MPTVEEMAKAMKVTVHKAQAIANVVEVVNAGFQGDSFEDNAGLNDSIEDERCEMPEAELGSGEELEKAIGMLQQIEPREAEVLILRFGLQGRQSLTLKEIGEKLGLTRERVRQIQRSACRGSTN